MAAQVDRDAWAREVAALIAQEAGGNKSLFGRITGVNPKTIDRWLTQSTNVSADSVRSVCRALRLPVTPMLVKVGYLEAEPSQQASAARLAEDAAAIRTIEAADVPPSLKRELLEHLYAQRAEHEKQRLAEIERMLALARRGRAG